MAGRQADTRYFIFLKEASSRLYLGVIINLAQYNTFTAISQAIINYIDFRQ